MGRPVCVSVQILGGQGGIMRHRETFTSKQKIMLLLSTAFLVSAVCFYLIFSMVYKNNIRDIVSADMKDNSFRIREYVELIFENADNMASIFTGWHLYHH